MRHGAVSASRTGQVDRDARRSTTLPAALAIRPGERALVARVVAASPSPTTADRPVGSTAREAADGHEPQQRPQARIDLDLLRSTSPTAPATRRQVSKGGFATRTRGRGRPGRGPRRHGQRAPGCDPTGSPSREFLVDEWLPTQRPPTLEESTYVSYARNIRLHVVPHIGGIPLQQLTPMDLNALYRTLLESGRQTTRRRRPASTTPPCSTSSTSSTTRAHLAAGRRRRRRRRSPTWPASPATPSRPLHRRAAATEAGAEAEPGLSNRTVRYVHTIIHAALRDALRWNRVTRNVADAATPPPQGSTRRGRHTMWTGEQLGRFLDFVADSPYLPAWLFLATSGSRRGEVLGLKWDDVDLDAATAIMSRQVTMVDHRIVVKELPKTKAGHMILLDPGTVEMLRNHRDRQAEIKRLLGAGYHDDGWIFCRPDGTPYHPERFSREFRPQAGDLQQGRTPTSRSRG